MAAPLVGGMASEALIRTLAAVLGPHDIGVVCLRPDARRASAMTGTVANLSSGSIVDQGRSPPPVKPATSPTIATVGGEGILAGGYRHT
jgi:hypothetical protein